MLVAAVQTAPKFKDVRGNVGLLTRMVEQAASKGTQLVVLPELCTSGYSFMSADEIRPYAEDVADGMVVKHFTALSKRLNIGIVWGMPLKRGNALFNGQIFVTPEGTKHFYHKINPWGNDYLWATPGEHSPPIVPFRGKEVGLLICRDIRDKSTDFQSFYEKGDADIVAFSSNFGDGGFPAVAWMDFARNNSTYLICSNRYGHEANNNFGEGGICIIEPGGKVHCEGLVWNAPCVVYANVP